MKTDINLKLVSEIVFTLFIGVIICILIFSMVSIGNRNKESQTEKLKGIIDKALVQCYALEGSFPTEIHELEKYGVIFDDKKYEYFYELFGTNYPPQVTVISKE